MDFLQTIKLYAKKPSNSIVNSAIKAPESVNWPERFQSTRRLIIDQLGRLKVEEMALRNLALKPEPNKKRTHSSSFPLSSTNNHNHDIDDFNNEHIDLNEDHKRFCTSPTNFFDLDTINQSELDLE